MKKDSGSKINEIPFEIKGLKDSKRDFKSSTSSNFNLFGKTDSADSSKKNKITNEDENIEIFLKQNEISQRQSFGKRDFVGLQINKINEKNID